MFSKIRKRLTYANVAMTLALVFAMSGGAYAASKYIITSTKQIKPSVLKSLKGKAGPAGAQGLKGEAGAAGASVTGKEGPVGKEGKEGPQGPPGTTGFTKTLPSGESEKGDWALGGEASFVEGSVSFGIPLGEAPTAHYIRVGGLEANWNQTTNKLEEVAPTKCGSPVGTAAKPKANPGNLCVYASEEVNTLKEYGSSALPKICAFGTAAGLCVFEATEGAADPYGFGLSTLSEVAGVVSVRGTWAVTAK